MTWIRVEDDLPPIGEEVFIFPRQYFDGVVIYTGKLHEDKKWEYETPYHYVKCEVTHWMRKPNDPE